MASIATVDPAADAWPILSEDRLYDARAERTRAAGADGVDEMADFRFGFPTAIRLADGALLATWWAAAPGQPATGISWARLRVVD